MYRFDEPLTFQHSVQITGGSSTPFTERIQLQPSPSLSQICHLAKNLYNLANYYIRQRFINEGRWTRYRDLYILLKPTEAYQNLPRRQRNRFSGYSTRTGNPFLPPSRIGGYIRVSIWDAHGYRDSNLKTANALCCSRTSNATSDLESFHFRQKPSCIPSRHDSPKGSVR